MKLERDLMRGAGPVAVLKVLAGGRRYGYELVKALAEESGGALAMGQSTLYPMLYNLEAQGYLRAEWESSGSARERKYYSLTAKGKRRLAKQTEQWRTVVEGMKNLGIVARRTGEVGA